MKLYIGVALYEISACKSEKKRRKKAIKNAIKVINIERIKRIGADTIYCTTYKIKHNKYSFMDILVAEITY